MKIELPQVTVVAVACNRVGETISSLLKTNQEIKPFKTILFTDAELSDLPGIEVVKIESLDWKGYNQFIIKELHKYIESEFVLVTQWDAWVLNGHEWQQAFENYDYIGAPWLYTDGRNVGNGGFSLRSKKLQEIIAHDDFIQVCDPEDEVLGRMYRRYLEENYQIKFAPEELAHRFSFELHQPVQPTFGFHAFHWKPYKETIVIKRTGAMGDVIMTEPVLEYFFKKGHDVALDTLPQFRMLFCQHHYPIAQVGELNPKLKVREINLDMAYEVKPKQNHLKSYYEFAGIKDGVMRNPKLSLGFPLGDHNRIFKQKYAVLHIDKREQAYRNIYGVNWAAVVKHLNKLGYQVFQLGRTDHEVVKGAIEMHTPNEHFLMYVVAGAGLFVGIDSGISHVASAYNVPSVIFFGSVDPEAIHPSLKNKVVIHNHGKENPCCEKPFCWGETVTTTGTECYIDNKKPPCTQFKTMQAIGGINEILEIEKKEAL